MTPKTDRPSVAPPKCCGYPLTYWEIPQYYDGALFTVCEACKTVRHRFSQGHYLRRRADLAIEREGITAGEPIDAR